MRVEPEPELPEFGVTLLLQLIELEEEFSVTKGGKEDGKNLAAFQALEFVAWIAEHYAGWALRHHAGRGKKCAEFVPLGPTSVQDLPFYQEARDQADSHAWELDGEAIYSERKWTKTTPDPLARPKVQRFMMWNILRPMMSHGIFPHRLEVKIRDAFDLAIHDAKSPLFSITSKSAPHERRRLQLRAVAHRAFRCGIGPVKAAEEKVSDAFGVEVETLNGWATQLRKHEDFGQLVVATAITFAENHASYVSAAGSTPADARDLRPHTEPYSNEILQEEGEAYRELDRRPKPKLAEIPKPKNKK